MDIRLSDYSYHLPQERIAMQPLAERDAAKLLVYEGGTGRHSVFRDIGHYLPQGSLLAFNDTKVVQARLHFQKDTGSVIEVFCLKPLEPFAEMSQAMQVQGFTVWECMIGNAKKWKVETSLNKHIGDDILLKAHLNHKDGRYGTVRFDWKPGDLTWSQILESAGSMPLPPYIDRQTQESDKEEYQTVFARREGAVAAPTAGLHFTEELIQKLKAAGHNTAWLTLHVSSGTFQPIEHEDILEHPMHNEQLSVTRVAIEKIKTAAGNIIAVGTTSARTMESLYWFGHKLLHGGETEEFFIEKLYPYSHFHELLPSVSECMDAILAWMETRELDTLWGRTEIFIFPGYRFRVCRGLITNFHLPGSTLILLVAALVGDDWKKIYASALEENYRFLSYGDGSLLMG